MKTSNLLPIMFLILFASCKNREQSTAPRYVANHGVKISYADSEKGDTTLLFVHGWCINKTYWRDQVKFFSKDYRVITIDLPGYGQSGKNRNDFSGNSYAGDVKAVVEQLKLNKVILIGHSMSGDIVLQAAIDEPKRVIGIVGIDNFKSVGINPPDTVKAKKEHDEAITLMKKNFMAIAKPYFNQQLFSKTTSEAVKERIMNDVAHADTVVAVKNMEGGFPDEVALLKKLNKKLYLLNSDYDPTDTSGLKINGIPFNLTYIKATGHYPMIEKPEEFNKLLLGILKGWDRTANY